MEECNSALGNYFRRRELGETQLEDGRSNGDLSLKQNALLLSASAISYFFKVWSKYAPIVSDKVEHST